MGERNEGFEYGKALWQEIKSLRREIEQLRCEDDKECERGGHTSVISALEAT